MKFIVVENGQPTGVPVDRPTVHKNVTGLQHSTDAFLISIGVYPVETTKPPFDPATETLDAPVYAVEFDKVTETFPVRPLTADELQALADEDAKRGRKDAFNALPDAKPLTVADVREIFADNGLA